MNESCGNNEYEHSCFENIKLIAVSAMGIGALICSALSAYEFFCGSSRNVRSAAKKRGKGYSAVYISDDRRSGGVFPVLAFLLTAAAGCLALISFADRKGSVKNIGVKEK